MNISNRLAHSELGLNLLARSFTAFTSYSSESKEEGKRLFLILLQVQEVLNLRGCPLSNCFFTSYLGEGSDSDSDIERPHKLSRKVDPSSQFSISQNTWPEPSTPQVPLGEQSNARVGIQDGQSSEAHPLAQEQIQSDVDEQFRRVPMKISATSSGN